MTLAGTIPGSTFLLNNLSVWAPIPPPALTDLTGVVNPSIFDPTGPCNSGPPAGCLQDGDVVVISTQAQAMPEPSTVALLLVMLTMTGILRRLSKEALHDRKTVDACGGLRVAGNAVRSPDHPRLRQSLLRGYRGSRKGD